MIKKQHILLTLITITVILLLILILQFSQPIDMDTELEKNYTLFDLFIERTDNSTTYREYSLAMEKTNNDFEKAIELVNKT
jgi:hypothetical protein